MACHSLTCVIILNPHRRQRRAQRSAKQAGGNVWVFLFACFVFLFGGSFWGAVRRRRRLWGDKIDEKRRQNLEEAEEVATGKFGCEMKVEKRRRKGRSVLGRGG